EADGIVTEIDWESFGFSDERMTLGLPHVADEVRTVLYNTFLVRPEEAPRRLTDLADPKWKGRIVAPAAPSTYSAILGILGEEEGLELVRKLVEEQDLALAQS